jgi:hypothetical protein
MSFEQPQPDMDKMLLAWQIWEKGEEMPGKTLANLKTAGLDEVLKQLIATGWKPTA